MCISTNGTQDLPQISLSIPNGWRYGQTIFNFLWWLKTNKGFDPEIGEERMADPFHLSNNEFIKLYNEYIKEILGGGDTKS